MVEDNIKIHLSDGWLVDKNKLGSCPLVKLEYYKCLTFTAFINLLNGYRRTDSIVKRAHIDMFDTA